jgi:nitrogen regulatory protein P-II 1
MVKVEAFIQPAKLADVRAALQDLDVVGIALSEVLGHGGSSSHKVVYRGAEYCVESSMTKLEMLVSSLQVDEVVDAISRAARTDSTGDDGMILIYEVADAVRIRTKERVEIALF